jgi:hypothetical protein
MTVSVRPRTKLLASLLAAGVVAATSAVTVPGHDALPALSNAAVRPASFITDTLYSLSDAVDAATAAAEIAVDAGLGLNYYWNGSDIGVGVPFNPLFAAAIALQNPSQIGSVLSYVTQLYTNPSWNDYPYYTYPSYFNSIVLQPLANLLPAPIGPAIVDALNNVADGINTAFQNALPDPTAAVDAMAALYDTTAGRLAYSTQLGIAAVPYVIAGAAYWAGYLPALVEASVESALAHPADIPGLVSNLIYYTVDPWSGLLSNLTYPFANAAYYAPSPIGYTGTSDGLVWSAYTSLNDGFESLLNSVLPTPIEPTPFASAAAAAPKTAAPARLAKSEAGLVSDSPAADTVSQAKDAPADESTAPTVSGSEQDGTDTDTPAATPAPSKAHPKAKPGRDGAAGAAAGHGHAKSDAGTGKSHGGAAA